MNKYKAEITVRFKKDLRKLKKHSELLKRLNHKTKEIVKDPHHYKILRNILKNRRRVHIGSFVLTFEVLEKEKVIVFRSFQHHDEVYKEE